MTTGCCCSTSGAPGDRHPGHRLGRWPRLGSAAAQAKYLAHLRADSIVLDCELIRRQRCGERPWSVLGQSFGGFCTVSYLSFAPHGMAEALIAGGLPGLAAHAEAVYRITYGLCADRCGAHYERYPDDIPSRLQAIKPGSWPPATCGCQTGHG